MRSLIAVLTTSAVAFATAAPAAGLEQTLTAPDGVAGNELSAVAVDGDAIVLGSPGADGSRGVAYVFTRSGDGWANTARLTASDRASGDLFGGSVAIDGDTIVVGAYGDASARGAVYTFARTGPFLRTETAKLTASDGTASDALGGGVSIDGDTIVAGAGNDGAGSAYTFASVGPAVRTETAKLTASDGLNGDDLGTSTAIDGDTIVVGAPMDQIGGNAFQGSAYTFTRTGPAARTQTAKLTASAGSVGDFLGLSVAIDGGTIAVSVLGEDAAATDQGAVYTFTSTGAPARNETAKLTASDGALNDILGNGPIGIDGETIVAGAASDDFGMSADQGSVYVFAATGAPARNETEKLGAAAGAADDGFGTAAAVSGTTVVGSSPYDDVGSNTDQGSATLFYEPLPVADTTPPATSRIKGPRKAERGRKVKYRFSADDPEAMFQCKVDRKPFKPCSSPLKVRTKKLKGKRHELRVRALDAAGNVDPTPSLKRFKLTRK